MYEILKKEDCVNNRKLSYINTQENNYNKHIKEYFKNVDDVTKLKYNDIYNFRETLRQKEAQNSEEKLSNNTINKIMILLKKIIDVGVRQGYYHSNPVTLLKKLPIEKKALSYYDIEEFKMFLKSFREDESIFKLLFTVLFFTGLRLGEALALNWNDIDFKNSTINIKKNIYFKGGKSYISTPKTKAGKRRVVINEKLTTALENWKTEQHYLLKEFIDNTDELQIFQDSPLILTKDMVERKYKTIRERNNDLKKIRIHDFRHSHASLLINQEEDYHIVKERLGHASITTTIDTSSHLYPNKQRTLADKLDELL